MKTLRIITGIFIQVFLMVETGMTQDTVLVYKRPLTPNYYNAQFAGNIGAMSVGAGYRMNRSRTLEWVIGCGYTPKYEAAKQIINLNFKNIFIPDEWRLGNDWYLYPQAGLGISRQFASGNNTFITLPDSYPEGYYGPNALRVHINLGGKIRKEFKNKRFFDAVEFYTETTTNDLYLTYYFKSRSVRLRNVFSMDVGINLITHNLRTPGIVVRKGSHQRH